MLANDRVILHKNDSSKVKILTKPLTRGSKVLSHWGTLDHDAVIGKNPREIVTTSTGRKLRVDIPSLEEYITLTPRLVTPVYPADANLVVSLLDINISPTDPEKLDNAPLEILEAGTGHGGITLHLARAIHSANPFLPTASPLRASTSSNSTFKVSTLELENVARHLHEIEESETENVQKWKSRRGAIVHTVETSSKHSRHAEKIVRGFRQGIYAGDIEFYVDDVSDWIEKQTALRSSTSSIPGEREFLTHAILDMPGADQHMSKVLEALHPNGMLIIFNPSITQIIDCVRAVKEKGLPAALERVLEVGPTVTGGREWDVRSVKPKTAALRRAEKDISASLSSADAEAVTLMDKVEPAESRSNDSEELQYPIRDDNEWVTVCRPKVGEMTIGGGFVGMWRKMRFSKVTAEE